MKMKLFLYLINLMTISIVYSQDGLSTTEFEKRMQIQKPQLLDVRTASEYQAGHLKNSLQADWLNKEQFADRIKYLDKNKPLLVYCASGMRSGAAAQWLLANGFKDVQNMKGGMTAWKMDGKSFEAPANIPQMTLANYQSLSKSGDIVLVDFGAEWCPPCKTMEPVLAQLQNELNGKYHFVKVDGGNDIDVMKANKVEALPVFIVYKKGKEVWRKQGVVELSVLKDVINK